MALKYGAKCTACNSDLRSEIDRRLLAGDPTRQVSMWLREEHRVILSHKSLAQHKAEHCINQEDIARIVAERDAVRKIERQRRNIDDDAYRRERLAQEQVQRIAASEESRAGVKSIHEEAIDRAIADVDMLDELARINMDLVRGLNPKLKDGNVSMPDATLFNGASATVVKCVAERREFMPKETPEHVEQQRFVVEFVSPVKPTADNSSEPGNANLA